MWDISLSWDILLLHPVRSSVSRCHNGPANSLRSSSHGFLWSLTSMVNISLTLKGDNEIGRKTKIIYVAPRSSKLAEVACRTTDNRWGKRFSIGDHQPDDPVSMEDNLKVSGWRGLKTGCGIQWERPMYISGLLQGDDESHLSHLYYYSNQAYRIPPWMLLMV